MAGHREATPRDFWWVRLGYHGMYAGPNLQYDRFGTWEGERDETLPTRERMPARFINPPCTRAACPGGFHARVDDMMNGDPASIQQEDDRLWKLSSIVVDKYGSVVEYKQPPIEIWQAIGSRPCQLSQACMNQYIRISKQVRMCY